MADSDQLTRFYEETYTCDPAAALRGERWRALSAVGKAEHVVALCAAAGIAPCSTLEVGCGDGAVLSALHALSFGGRLHGLEISPSAVRIAGQRAEIDSVEVYDGERLPLPDGAHELGILCHVLEHVPAPAALLAEVGRVCGAVVVEVPLEANISALRPSRRGHSTQVGHLQRLDRRAVRELVADAGMRVAGELTDPLPVAVHLFFAQGLLGRVAGRVRWAVRAGLHRLAPTLARRVFTVHYACLCVATDAPPAAMDARPAVV